MDNQLPKIPENLNTHEDPLLSNNLEPNDAPRPTEELDLEFEDDSEGEQDDQSEEEPSQKIYDPLNIKPEFSNNNMIETAKAKLQLKHAHDTSFEYEDSSDTGEDDEFTEEPIKAYGPKENSAGMFVSGGVCCSVFTLSVILWVVLFADLTKRALQISRIVEQTPTLEVYYDMYEKFYKGFSESTGAYDKIEKQLTLKDNDDLSVFKRSVLSALTLNSRLSRHVEELERAIPHKIYQDLMPKVLNSLSIDYADLETQVTQVKQLQSGFTGFYDHILKNVQMLYAKAFDLIDLYGRFYVNTNRIWVSTENIYQLYDKRALEIQTEAKKKHFQRYTVATNDVKLSHFDFQNPGQVKLLAPLNFDQPNQLFLSCFIRTEVNNPDLNYLDRSFSLSLGLKNPLSTNSLFSYGVTEKFNRVSFHQALILPPGSNQINLYAKVNKGDLELKYVNVECLVFESYADIAEYGIN